MTAAPAFGKRPDKRHPAFAASPPNMRHADEMSERTRTRNRNACLISEAGAHSSRASGAPAWRPYSRARAVNESRTRAGRVVCTGLDKRRGTRHGNPVTRLPYRTACRGLDLPGGLRISHRGRNERGLKGRGVRGCVHASWAIRQRDACVEGKSPYMWHTLR